MTHWLPIVLAVAVASLGCRNARGGEDALRFETLLEDTDAICDRVDDVLESDDEGLRRLELPAVAEAVVQNSGRSAPVRKCGERFLGWLEAELRTRPLDLRPRLESRVLALEPFLVLSDPWRQRALESLSALLLRTGTPIVHPIEDFTYLGPGSQKMSIGWSASVSRDDLDRWATFTLHRGNERRTYLLRGRWNWTSDDGYVDLVVNYLVQRYDAPTQWFPPMLRSGASGAFGSRSAPPAPEKLGLGNAPIDWLWVDLERAFNARPDDPRLKRLPSKLYERLRMRG